MISNKRGKFLVKFLLFFIIIIGLAIGCFLGGLWYINSPMDKESKDNITVVIPVGSSTVSIGDILEKDKVIKDSFYFKIISKLYFSKEEYKAGTYNLSPSMSLKEIGAALVKGEKGANVTIPEGYTLSQIEDLLAAKKLIDRNKFKDLVRNGEFDYWFLKDVPKGDNRLEGYLMPDTYNIVKGMDEREIIELMLDNFNRSFPEKDVKKAADKLKLSPRELLTVASIIEREAQKSNERPKVASVIYNRLAEGMNLQMCSTVQYAKGEHKEFLNYDDTSFESPYNTYLHKGLPPGPISCPGKDSIKAALEPDKTDYLFFVVSDKLDGSMKFSKDYDTFEKNKEAYYKAVEAIKK